MQNLTKGHSAVQGGLRGHSIGETYPIAVSYKGVPGHGYWYTWHALSGTEFGQHKSAALAHAEAVALKEALDSIEYLQPVHEIDINQLPEVA